MTQTYATTWIHCIDYANSQKKYAPVAAEALHRNTMHARNKQASADHNERSHPLSMIGVPDWPVRRVLLLQTPELSVGRPTCTHSSGTRGIATARNERDNKQQQQHVVCIVVIEL